MAAISDYLENKLLDHVLRNTSLTSPSAVFLALYSASPTDTGAAGTEISGGSYARQTITFGAAASGTISNSAEISFTTMPACTVAFIGVHDHLTNANANMLFHGALSASKSVDAGDTFKIAIGDLDISLD
jgi:hypothetical protein